MRKGDLHAGLRAAVFLVVFMTMHASAKGVQDMLTVEQKHQANRLIKETSPYLLQHAYNPVDWYPWSPQAFKVAKDANKPIFLSIGYSTCHWCHVMAHESFENPQIAEILNKYFISIKVDREQRPDVDDVYMNAVRMMTGSGGWPLSVFLTPEAKPFYGGTYFPPEDKYGRIGFKRLLTVIADAWQNRRDELTGSAAKIHAILDAQPSTDQAELNDDAIKAAVEYFKAAFDSNYAGFSSAPKFPQPGNLSLLLRYANKTRDRQAVEMVEKTLDAMANGGIHDHLAGGFHRYSTDQRWLVPHFEKMLYDQALLAKAYIQTYQLTGKDRFANTARRIFQYLLQDMTAPQGAFYSAEDADSQGAEGTFYVWTPAQIREILGTKNADIFNQYYNVTKKGNFEHKRSILNITVSLDQFAKKHEKTPEQIEKILSDARLKLLKERSKRPRPHRDEKIITAWNSMMISALAYASQALDAPEYAAAAKRSADFILKELRPSNRLMRYYAKGRAVELAFLDDYAFLLEALIDLYQATFETKYLTHATSLADEMITLFRNKETHTFYLTGSDAQKLIVRTTPSYDGALPCGNSIAAMALLRLGRITATPRFTDTAEELLKAFSSRLAESPVSLTSMLMALDYYFGPGQEIVIAGTTGEKDTEKMLRIVRSAFLPNAVILLHDRMQGRSEPIEKLVPFIKNQNMIGNKATAYICENYVCKKPVNTPSRLRELIAEKAKTLKSKQILMLDMKNRKARK